MKTLLLLVPMLMASCTYMDAGHMVALGGKGAYSGRDFSGTWDNEKSFSDGAILAGVAVGAAQAVAVQRSADGLSKAVNTNATKQAINASNNVVKTAEINAGVTKATTLNPNVIPK